MLEFPVPDLNGIRSPRSVEAYYGVVGKNRRVFGSLELVEENWNRLLNNFRIFVQVYIDPTSTYLTSNLGEMFRQ